MRHNETQSRKVTFRANIPSINSAIYIDGEEGARIKLDIAEIDLLDFLPVLPMRQSVLKVTFERYE